MAPKPVQEGAQPSQGLVGFLVVHDRVGTDDLVLVYEPSQKLVKAYHARRLSLAHAAHEALVQINN
jgi:hypothetical protein